MTRDSNSSTRAPRSGSPFLRYACLLLIAVLYVISVPWYRDANAPLEIWFGLPDWVAVALLCYVGVAVLNGIAWLATDIPDIEPLEESPDPEGASK